MNYSNNNTPFKGRPKKRGFKSTPKSNKKNNGMSKQIGAKINDKVQAQFSFMKRIVYSDHHESANFPIGFENQGNNICFFNSVMQILFLYLLSETALDKVPMIIKEQF